MKSKLSLFALAVLLLAARAEANQFWTWTGDCLTVVFGASTVCDKAIFEAITIDAYVPGSLVERAGGDPNTLVSASYADDAGGFQPAFDFFHNGFALEFPAVSGEALGFLRTEGARFLSFPDGSWEFSAEGAAPDCTFGQPGNLLCSYRVNGNHGTWTRVPGPSTLALVALGLVGLAD